MGGLVLAVQPPTSITEATTSLPAADIALTPQAVALDKAANESEGAGHSSAVNGQANGIDASLETEDCCTEGSASTSISSNRSVTNSSPSSTTASSSNNSSSESLGTAPGRPPLQTSLLHPPPSAAVGSADNAAIGTSAFEVEDTSGQPHAPVCDVNELSKGRRQVCNGMTRVGRMEVSISTVTNAHIMSTYLPGVRVQPTC